MARPSKYPFETIPIGGEYFVQRPFGWTNQRLFNTLTSCRANAEKRLGGTFELKTANRGLRWGIAIKRTSGQHKCPGQSFMMRMSRVKALTGKTQDQLAEHFNVDPVTIRNWLSNRSRMRPEYVVILENLEASLEAKA